LNSTYSNYFNEGAFSAGTSIVPEGCSNSANLGAVYIGLTLLTSACNRRIASAGYRAISFLANGFSRFAAATFPYDCLDPDYGMEQTFIVERDRLASRPMSYLKELGEACGVIENLNVSFSGEAGVDGGGLTKELFSLLFMHLLSNEDGSSRGIFSFTEDELLRHELTAGEFYKIIFKDIFGYIRRQDSFLIESIIDEALLTGVFGLPVEVLKKADNVLKKTGSYEEPAVKIALLAISSPLNDRIEDESVRVMNSKCFNFLTESKVDFSEMEGLAQAIEGVEDEELEDLKVDKEKYREFVRGAIESHIHQQFMVQAQNILHFVLVGIEAGHGNDGIDIFSGVQAPFDKSSVIDSIVMSDSVLREEKDALVRKIDLLKQGLEELATDEEVKLFARFVTGSSALKPKAVIKIGVCSDGVNYISAASCFNLLLIHLPAVEGRDDTAAGLLQSVLSNMQDPTYTNR
jgi:hypothetical protein